MKDFLKKLILTKEGKASLTKVGLWLAGIPGALLLTGICPPAMIPYAKAWVVIMGTIAGAGARDAIDKK